MILQSEHDILLMWSYRCMVKKTLTALCSYKTSPQSSVFFRLTVFLYSLLFKAASDSSCCCPDGKRRARKIRAERAPFAHLLLRGWMLDRSGVLQGYFKGYLRPTCDGGIWKLHPSLLARPLREVLRCSSREKKLISFRRRTTHIST